MAEVWKRTQARKEEARAKQIITCTLERRNRTIQATTVREGKLWQWGEGEGWWWEVWERHEEGGRGYGEV